MAMRLFKNPANNDVYGYDTTDQQNFIDSAIAAGWQEVTGNWPPSPTEDQLKLNCKDEAKQRLERTDYSQLPDVDATLVNRAEFVTYRTQIRDLYLNPVANPVWPNEPIAIWNS